MQRRAIDRDGIPLAAPMIISPGLLGFRVTPRCFRTETGPTFLRTTLCPYARRPRAPPNTHPQAFSAGSIITPSYRSQSASRQMLCCTSESNSNVSLSVSSAIHIARDNACWADNLEPSMMKVERTPYSPQSSSSGSALTTGIKVEPVREANSRPRLPSSRRKGCRPLGRIKVSPFVPARDRNQHYASSIRRLDGQQCASWH